MSSKISISATNDELIQRDYELASLLDRILKSCDLPSDLRRKAEDHYKEKAQHLQKCPFLSRYEVVIKPQGSASTETTVPPVARKHGEFDVDLLIAIEAGRLELAPSHLHREIGSFLRKEYAKELSPIRLGWKLDYALEDRMHFDIVPAVRHLHPECGSILAAPDWANSEWKNTNPEGYSKGFLEACARLPIYTRKRLSLANIRESTALLAAREPSVEPFPKYSAIKKPLQRVVQLTKRHRDFWFSRLGDGGLKRRPASIVITTILWYAYEKYVADKAFESVYAILIKLAEALVDPSIVYQIEDGGGVRFELPNPSLPEENLVAKWNNANNRLDVEDFFSWAKDYRSFILALATVEGRHELHAHLKNALGSEYVTPAFKAEAELVAPGNKERSRLCYAPAFGLVAVTSTNSSIPLKSHTFHGVE